MCMSRFHRFHGELATRHGGPLIIRVLRPRSLKYIPGSPIGIGGCFRRLRLLLQDRPPAGGGARGSLIRLMIGPVGWSKGIPGDFGHQRVCRDEIPHQETEGGCHAGISGARTGGRPGTQGPARVV